MDLAHDERAPTDIHVPSPQDCRTKVIEAELRQRVGNALRQVSPRAEAGHLFPRDLKQANR
jgi:hypothetical protein